MNRPRAFNIASKSTIGCRGRKFTIDGNLYVPMVINSFWLLLFLCDIEHIISGFDISYELTIIIPTYDIQIINTVNHAYCQLIHINTEMISLERCSFRLNDGKIALIWLCKWSNIFQAQLDLRYSFHAACPQIREITLSSHTRTFHPNLFICDWLNYSTH